MRTKIIRSNASMNRDLAPRVRLTYSANGRDGNKKENYTQQCLLTLESPGEGQMEPHRFFRPKIWSFQVIKMKLSLPVVR